MKTNPNTSTDPNSSLADDTQELSDKDLNMIVGAGSQSRDESPSKPLENDDY